MTRLGVSKARQEFADLVNRVAYGGERVVVHRRGKDLVAVIPAADLAALEALEDRLDAEESLERLAKEKPIPWAKARRKAES